MLIKKLNHLFSNKRFFSQLNELHPWFITGIFDAEACFNIIITKSPSTNLGWMVKLRVIIELHKKDIGSLREAKSFFGGIGTVNVHSKRNSVVFQVTNINHLVTRIVPHFEKYSLQSSKRANFELWKECVNLLVNKEHLTQNGLEKIVYNKKFMHNKISNQLLKAFPNILFLKPPRRKNVIYSNTETKDNNSLLDPNWISGFIEGDGSFYIILNEKKNMYISEFQYIFIVRKNFY